MVRHLITVQLSLLQILFVYIFIHFTVCLVCFSLGGGLFVWGDLFDCKRFFYKRFEYCSKLQMQKF